MAKKFEMPSVSEKNSTSEGRIKILQEVVDKDKRKKSDARIEILRTALAKGKNSKEKEAESKIVELDAELPPEVPEYEEYKVEDGEEGEDMEIEDARAELAERMETLKARQELQKKWKRSNKKEAEPKVDVVGEFEVAEKEEPAKEPAEKVIVQEEHEEPVYELTKKKNNFNPEKMSLDELDDRVNEMWKAMDKILKDTSAYNPTKEEKRKLQKFTKKGGAWPLDDIVTAENFQKYLADYGVANYIDPSLIEKGKDVYAVVAKQYGIYRDALEKRIRKAKLKQLEEAEGKATSKKEKKEREDEVVIEIEAKLPPQPPAYEKYKIKTKKEDVAVELEAELPPDGAEMPWELKRKLGEDIEVKDEDIEEEMEDVRNSLDESEKELKKTGHEFEKSGYKKGKIKKETDEVIDDPLGIGDVLREEQKEHAKKIKTKLRPIKKKGFWARLFRK